MLIYFLSCSWMLKFWHSYSYRCFNFYQRCQTFSIQKLYNTCSHYFSFSRRPLPSVSSRCFPRCGRSPRCKVWNPHSNLNPPVMPQEAANMYITTYIYIICVCVHHALDACIGFSESFTVFLMFALFFWSLSSCS
jgi:hypothetical protein